MKNLAVALFFAFCYLSTGCTDTLVDPSEVCVSFSLDKIQTPLGTVVRVTPTILDIQYELTVTANHRLGRHEEVVAILDDVPIFDIRSASAISVASLGALSHSELGNDAQARTWFRIARSLFEHLTAGDVQPWERSAYYADYREANAKLNR